MVIPLIGKSCIHLLSWDKYTSINFLTHEDIKLIEYGLRTNISLNNFQVSNHASLETNLCSSKDFYGQIRDCKCHHIMSIFNINNEQISNKHNNQPQNTNFDKKKHKP